MLGTDEQYDNPFFEDLGPPKARLQGLPPGDAGTKKTVEAMKRVIASGMIDPRVREQAINIIRSCKVKDVACEAKQIFFFVRDTIRWTRDVWNKETVQSVPRTLKWGAGDCLPSGTLLLRSDYKFVPIADIQVGEWILGHDGWTPVLAKIHKGKKAVLSFELTNKCLLRATPNHRVFIMDEATPVEVRAGELKDGDILRTPDRVPVGQKELDPDIAYVEGLYVADGWSDNYRFCISGKDGHPKRAQKEAVATICARRGVKTRWHPRYIAVNDSEWTTALAGCGTHTVEKRCNLGYDLESSSRLLEGLQADSGVTRTGTRVFSTISHELALQIRLLLRMVRGSSCSIRLVEKHGGLGKHPIYRVTERCASKTAPRRLFVKSCLPEVQEDTYDVTTGSGTIYLPESDTVVHNCDDKTSVLIALLYSVGIGPCRIKVIAADDTRKHDFSHVYAQLMVNGSWMNMDPSPPGAGFGWEHPTRYREAVYPV